jgi:hypothetical protein
VNSAAFRRLCLSLPGAHEEPHHERTSFRVGSKIFATMDAGGREAMVKTTAAAARARIADDPGTFFDFGAWTERLGALGVRLSEIDEPRMRELATESWRRIAPARAVAEHDGVPARAVRKIRRKR